MLTIVMLTAIAAGSGLFLSSLEKNQLVHNLLIDVFQHDPKVQQDLSRGEATISAEEFASNAVEFAKEILIYPFFMLITAILLSLVGILTIRIHSSLASSLLALAGVLSLFTFVPAVLLFEASRMIFNATESLRIIGNRNTTQGIHNDQKEA